MKSDEELKKMIAEAVAAALRSGIPLTYGEHPLLDESIAQNVKGLEKAQWN